MRRTVQVNSRLECATAGMIAAGKLSSNGCGIFTAFLRRETKFTFLGLKISTFTFFLKYFETKLQFSAHLRNCGPLKGQSPRGPLSAWHVKHYVVRRVAARFMIKCWITLKTVKLLGSLAKQQRSVGSWIVRHLVQQEKCDGGSTTLLEDAHSLILVLTHSENLA